MTTFKILQSHESSLLGIKCVTVTLCDLLKN